MQILEFKCIAVTFTLYNIFLFIWVLDLWIGNLFSSTSTFSNKAGVLYVKWRKKFVAWGEWCFIRFLVLHMLYKRWYYCCILFQYLYLAYAIILLYKQFCLWYSSYPMWRLMLITIWTWDWKRFFCHWCVIIWFILLLFARDISIFFQWIAYMYQKQFLWLNIPSAHFPGLSMELNKHIYGTKYSFF